MAEQLELLPPRLSSPLPSIDCLPHDGLSDIVYSKRPGNRGRLALSRRTTVVLWLLVALGIGGCIELFRIVRSTTECSGLACSVVTFGGHPQLVLVLAAAGTAALLATAVVTRGFTYLGGNALWLAVPATGLTFAAVAGVLAVAVATLLFLFVAILTVVLVCAYFADHS